MSTLPTAAFNSAKSIVAAKKVIQFVLDTGGTTAATASGSGSTIADATHTFIEGQLIQYVSGTGFTGLTAGTNYFVRDVVAATSFAVAATLGGAAISITVAGSAGVFRPCEVFESKMAKHNASEKYDSFKRYASNGVLRDVGGKYIDERIEKVSWEIDEAKRLLTLFGGKLSGLATGKVTMWVRDPRDASGKTALTTSAFQADVTRDADITFDKQVIAMVTAESKDDDLVTFTPDGSIV